MDTDACSQPSKVDRWLNQLIPPDVSGRNSPRKVARRKHQRKDQGLYRDPTPDQKVNIPADSKRAHEAHGQCEDSVVEDRRVEVEKWISRTATSPGATRQRPSSHISGSYASRSPHQLPQRRHSTEHQILAGNAGHKRRRLPSEASYESTPKQHIERPPQFEKRPRHKTREDRYDTHHSKHPRKATEARADSNIDRDRQRSRKAALSKPSRDVVAKFTSDAILSERVTTHPGPGLFGKLNSIKRPLVDLEFHEMNFLQAPCEDPSAKNPSRARVRERNRQDRLNEEVSAFFTKAAPVSTGLRQEHHKPTTPVEYWTNPDRVSARRSDSCLPQSRSGSAGRATVRILKNHPSESSGGISSPLRRELLQRLEQVGCADLCKTNSSLIGSSSMGNFTRSIIETGVLDGTGSPRRLSYTQPPNHANLDFDSSLLQTVANTYLPTVTMSGWNHQPKVKKNKDLEFLATEAVPLLRRLSTTQNDADPIKQAHVSPLETEPSVDTQGCIDLSASSTRSLPSSIPTRPEPPKSRLVQALQRAADTFTVSQPYENLGGQVNTELQADRRLDSRILQPSISNIQQLDVVPNAAMTLLPSNPDLQFGFPQRHDGDSGFYHDIAKTSTSSIQTLPTKREDFHCHHVSPSPLISQDAQQLTVNHRQLVQSTDMAHYIATIEDEVLGIEGGSKLSDSYNDDQWERKTEAYIESVERSQDGYTTGPSTRRGLTLPLAAEEDTGISMVDFWTRNPFVH